MSRVTHLSLSGSLVITFVLVLYHDTGQGVTITSCGFEDDNSCGYSLFNWMRRSGDTADTGPSNASEGSYYLYIEADNVGDRGVLRTPGLYWAGPACVRLAYHMYGVGNGTLALLLSEGWRQILYKTGNQGNSWIRYQTTIQFDLISNTSFVIEGIRGIGDKGDIAIDDFSVVTGECNTVSLPYSCSFESDLCEMWQESSDHLDWVRTHKDNPDPESGSPGDSGGDWIISLASDGRYRIGTPELNFTGDICVKFKYYLSSNVCEVYVKQANADMSWFDNVYSDVVETGAIWRSVSLTVKSFVRYRLIIFYGRIYGGQAASIALDEIYISKNICDDCAVNNGGCSQTCRNTDTGPMCSCRSGYRQVGETGCQDIDECATATDNECDHGCNNMKGNHSCSCLVTYILATDGRHCIECESAYERRVAASQLQTSDCQTTSSYANITLDDCLLVACGTQTGVVDYFNMVCNLKLCDGNNLRFNTVSGTRGWDIYVLNTTWPGFIMGGDPDEPRVGDSFPLVAVVAGVVVPVILLVVIVIAVVFIVRRRGLREEDQSVQSAHYAGQPASVGEVRTPPINENQAEVGIYDEVTETPERQSSVTNTQVTYRNAAFQGAHQYLDLDLGLGEYLTPTP